ncbi:MAG: sugar ABC transporter permease [Actinomycetales bacterium]
MSEIDNRPEVEAEVGPPPSTGAEAGTGAGTVTARRVVRKSEGGGSVAQSDFAGDAGAGTILESIKVWWQRVRGGEVGALPAILGLVVMLGVFTWLGPRNADGSSIFLSVGNLANLPAQAAATAVIAIGLVFVLLLGEIDLSAGTASGVCAGLMGMAVTKGGALRDTLGTVVWVAVIVLMVAAVVVAATKRLWWAAAIVALGVVFLLANQGGHVLVAVFLALATGTAIGLLTGFLVARVGIPSFVVTLALFLAWQGVLLQFIGNGGAVGTRDFVLLNGIAHNNLSPALGWVLLVVVLAVYTGYTVQRSIRRRAEGLSAEPLSLVYARSAVLAVVGIVAVFFLNAERSPNPEATSIRGVPYVVPIVLLLMVFWALVLTKTRFGRYIYSVGGNAEASRRAGIDVTRIRMASFTICSAMAGIGGVIAASYLGGVPADAGGGNQLLYAVGAAVIGGTSLFGGRGRPRDAVLGALVISLIPNGLNLMGLNASVNFMVTGLVLLVAASVDALSRKRASVS